MEGYETLALPWTLIFLGLIGGFIFLVTLAVFFPRGGRSFPIRSKHASQAPLKKPSHKPDPPLWDPNADDESTRDKA